MSRGAELHRAYSIIEVKSVDDEQRVIEGIATSPAVDRMGDVVEPDGAKFSLPVPLLWQHRSDEPVGFVTDARVTKQGIRVKAQIAKGVLPRIDEAWALIKAGLVRGLSIGFRGLESEPIKGTFGLRFTSWELLELSVVTVPANAEASITAIKSFDAPHLAATGRQVESTEHKQSAGASAPVVHMARKGAKTMPKTFSERVSALENERAAKAAQIEEIQTKASDEGRTKTEDERESFATLKAEIASIDEELKDLKDLAAMNIQKAAPVKGDSQQAASESRQAAPSYVSVKENRPVGIGFARTVMAKTVARLDNRYVVDVAKEMFPSDQAVHAFFQKATVTAGTAENALWAGNLIDQTNLTSEFVDFLRPQTILGKFGQNGVPSLRRVPFNIRFNTQTTGGAAGWVGGGKPKPLTGFEFTATTLLWFKVAAIAVITQELARFSTPSAETLVRDGLAGALIERLDIDFVDPANSAVANVSPASITNGLTALTSAGTSADNVRTDIQSLLEQFILANLNPTSLVLIMPNTLALALSLMVNDLGNNEFPGITMNGGTLRGIPVITSQYAANQSGAGNLVIAVNANDVLLADDGQVRVDMSTEASLQMSDTPTNDAATGTGQSLVSMFQTDSIALRAERFINWQKRRTSAVVYMDDVNWGSIGSPS